MLDDKQEKIIKEVYIEVLKVFSRYTDLPKEAFSGDNLEYKYIDDNINIKISCLISFHFIDNEKNNIKTTTSLIHNGNKPCIDNFCEAMSKTILYLKIKTK